MASNTGEEVRTEDGIGRREEVEDLEDSLESLKQEKGKAKSAFTLARKQLLEPRGKSLIFFRTPFLKSQKHHIKKSQNHK